MRSYQFTEYGQPLESVDAPTPAPTGTEVVLRIEACGVCHSDVHVWQGYFAMGGDRKLDVRASRELPFTLGHEIAGEVVAVGPDASTGVDGSAPVVQGMSVVAFPWIGCGDCDICVADREHLCHRPRALGTHVDGGFADHVIVPHPRYLFTYGDAATDLAATYACSGLTAYSALLKVRDRVGPQLVMIGAGGVGLAGIRIARALYDCELIVVEIEATKLEAAKAAGAAHVVDGRDEDAAKQLKVLTGGGCAAVIDWVGNDASASLGFRTVAKSGILVMVGLMGGSLRVPLPLMALKDLTIQGSDLGSLAEMRELMGWVRAGRIEPIPFETRSIECVNEALTDLEAGRVLGRVVLSP